MTRRIAFYVGRINQLRVIAPVVDYLVRRRAAAFSVTVLFPGWSDSKPALQPTAENLMQAFGDRVALHRLETPEAFLDSIRAGAWEMIVNLSLTVAQIDRPMLKRLIAESRTRGIKWIALPYTLSHEYFLLEDPDGMLDTWDLICVVGHRSIEYIESRLTTVADDVAKALRERLVVIGSPEYDGIDRLGDGEDIRRRHGLPVDKRLIFLASAPVFFPFVNKHRHLRGLEARFRAQCGSLGDFAAMMTSWRYPCVIPYRRYLSALRAFADSNDACVVAKTRAKHSDPAYLSEYVDYEIGDRSYFPYTTLELLKVSSLYIGFYSATAIEAVVMGNYAISILCLPVELVEPLATRRDRAEALQRRPGSLWNTRGVSEIIDGTRRSSYRTLDHLARSNFDAYAMNPSQRLNLLDQFVSYIGSSSERFAEVLQSRWSGRGP